MSLRKLIMILLLGLSLGLVMTGCSSGDTEGDFSEESSDDFSDDFGEESGGEGDDDELAGDGFEDDVEDDDEGDFGDEEGDEDEFADEDDEGDEEDDEFADEDEEGDEEDDEFADEDEDEFGDEEDDEFADEDDEFADEDDEFADEDGEGDGEDDEFADEDFEGEGDDEFSDDELEGDGELAADAGEEAAGDEDFENFDENAAVDQELDGDGTGDIAADDTGVEDIPDEEFISEAGADTAEASNDDIGEADPLIDSDGGLASDSYAEVNAKLGLVSVKKIYTTPYQKNGRLLNSVYIGRPGDTVVSASMRIYNQDRSADIIADNPWLGDGIKPGEKMYYNSPNRPQDNTTVLTFYEDAGVPSKTYTTKEGDNIRTLATNFLGFQGAWKEVWATNLDVESKDVMPAGVNLKYWPSAGGAVNMASAPMVNPGFAADPGMGAPADPNSANLGSNAPMNDPGMAGMNPAMDPTMNAGANVNPVNPAADPFAGNPQAGSLDPMDNVGQVPEPVDAPPMDPIAAQPAVDLPPENPADMAPPSVDPIGASSPAEIAKQANGNNSMVLLLVGVIALAAVALIAIQIKNKKRPPSMEYTQV